MYYVVIPPRGFFEPLRLSHVTENKEFTICGKTVSIQWDYTHTRDDEPVGHLKEPIEGVTCLKCQDVLAIRRKKRLGMPPYDKGKHGAA